MITVPFCFPHHVTRQAARHSIHTHIGSPMTAIIASPHHAAQQRVYRSIRTVIGSPITVKVAAPHHVSQQREYRSIRTVTGSPITVQVAMPHHVSRQTEHRSSLVSTGRATTAAIVLSSPLIRTEWQSAHDRAGNPVTASFVCSPPLLQTELCSTFDQAGSAFIETLVFPKLPVHAAAIKWKSQWRNYTATTLRFRNDYRNFVTASIAYRYDWMMVHRAVLQYRHWSVVPAGWRIIAKNLETEESLDLGFIDTENPVLENLFLPDGDYEISVLTSSLFWKDCLDRTVRTISVRPDEEVIPLPTIYNLRSAVQDGVTTIRWSANRSEHDDCIFCIWYSPETPVDKDRPADQTLWYDPLRSEYTVTFFQNAPAYIAVASMRNGNGETGKVHELYLDWNSVPPRRPDDVTVLNASLKAADTPAGNRDEDDPFSTMWDG